MLPIRERLGSVDRGKLGGLTKRLESRFHESNNLDQEEEEDTTISSEGVGSIGAKSLEATMTLKYSSASSKNTKWWRGYVLLNLEDGGSISIYSEKPQKKESDYVGGYALNLKTKRNRHSTRIGTTMLEFTTDIQPILEIPAHVNWIGKDFEKSSKRFIVEIPTDNTILPSATEAVNAEAKLIEEAYEEEYEGDDDDIFDKESFVKNQLSINPKLQECLENAKAKEEPFRLHFECLRKGHEKDLWLKAFEKMNRYSFEVHHRTFVTKILKDTHLKHERIRNEEGDRFSRQTKALEQDFSSKSGEDTLDLDDELIRKDSFRLKKRNDEKEYLVQPHYAYPSRWMTDSELYSEMLKPSTLFHDLRVPSEKQKEIGVARVEVLQCAGLPILDFASETDAVIYLVCGSYAFTTDVIYKKLNPMWLPRVRRACIFPLFHAYAQIYVGVFDDDGKGKKDDFAGRVVLDLARCRPGSTFDVTLPLRQSSHVYSRKKCGVIRLRFSIDYYSEREALLSYIPKTRNLRTFDIVRPNDDVTVLCGDEKAFRNITQTVHGIHMPGKFSTSYMRATTKEIQFVSKLAMNTIRKEILEIIFWKTPSLTFIVFFSWMSAVYWNSLGMVPCQVAGFCFLIMLRNYVFYGSDGRIQQGFIPPSIEEMLYALIGFKGDDSKAIRPLFVRPHEDERSNLIRGETYETHLQQGKSIFELLGFESISEYDYPEDYHMEIPFSRGLTHPVKGDYQYPRFSVKEAMVQKSGKFFNRVAATEEEEEEEMLDNFFQNLQSLDTVVTPSKKDAGNDGNSVQIFEKQSSGRSGFTSSGNANMIDVLQGMTEKSKGVTEGVKAFKRDVASSISGFKLSNASDFELSLLEEYRNLPSDMKIPVQDINATTVKDGKKLIDDLHEFRDTVHKFSFHLFNDKAYTVAPDSVYFGRGKKEDKSGNQTQIVRYELDRLLNCGQHISGNPVRKYIGVHLEPLIKTFQGGLCTFRSIYFVLTWRDPILSFWVTLGLAIAAFILSIFPFRLFFFVLGVAVVGPQNWVFAKFVRPNIIEELKEKKIEKRRKKNLEKLKNPKSTLPLKELAGDQPIISSHTSDNTAPPNLSIEDLDKREVHQVCVPYSQIKYNRDYHWPPEPRYAKCDPYITVADGSIRLPKSPSPLPNKNSKEGKSE